MKRKIEVTIGVPDSLREANDAEGPDPLEDCYCVNFTEEGIAEGFTAQSACLCTLALATEMWLEGATTDEVQAAMASDSNHEHSEEE